MSEDRPSTRQRVSELVRNPKRLMLALLRRSPLRSILSRLELMDSQQQRITSLEERVISTTEVHNILQCRVEAIGQMVDIHREWFVGVKTRADAHHDWITGQQRHLNELQQHAGNAVARANLTDLHLGDYAERIEALERLVDAQRGILHFHNFQTISSQHSAKFNTEIALLFDIRITQIERRERGISRYTASLALALGAQLPGKVSFLIDPSLPLPDQIDELRTCGNIVDGVESISALPSVSHFLQGCIFNLSNTVEDIFPIQLAPFQTKIWAICYDLVPLVFPGEYLKDPYSSMRYNSFVKSLSFVDMHLAISQTSGNDLTRLVGISPSQVKVIMGGIDTHRWPTDRMRVTAPIFIKNGDGEQFFLTAPFWLYVGGNDFRKNIKGLIEAFSIILKANMEPAPQLVIACHITPEARNELNDSVEKLGLVIGRDLVITGWISDNTLSACYQAAFGTIFPSLYEGLGLPVLESYFFGTPALASDSSSLREITAPDCRFDPTSAQSIADAMLRLHQDPALAVASLAWGKEMLQICDWTAIAVRVAGLLGDDLRSSPVTGKTEPA